MKINCKGKPYWFSGLQDPLVHMQRHTVRQRSHYIYIRIDYDININTCFSIVGGVSGFFPLTILGVCLAGTSAILDQDTAKDSRTTELQSVNTKLVSMKQAVDAVTAGMSKIEVGLNFLLQLGS